jgi:methylated-DNA-[protein]-cysteine S-methyltransferase
LDDYFHGRRRNFELPLAMDTLTPFTTRVLRTLAQVKYGSTLTYGELAALAGFPSAARAVGRAMATNPFPIIIPCHRVLGAGGKMTGYSGGEGIATKQWLLRFEAGNP